MPPASRRGEIVEAAARIVERSGAAHLTIDAVATEAGFSKGGVLYHFPTKQALLEGMLEQLIEQVQARSAACRAAEGDLGNAALVGRIVEEYDQQPDERAMARAVLAAAAENPDMLEPARDVIAVALREAAAGSQPAEMGWVLQLATEGLRFLDMLNLLPLSVAERDRLHACLLQLAREHSV